MDKYKKRIENEAILLVEKNKTIREIAKELNVSKSTVHNDLREKLPKVNLELSNKVNEILNIHKQERHLRGGESTKNKYKNTR